jgi:hypothetical protein
MCRKIRLLKNFDETPLIRIYGLFLRFSIFYTAFAIYEIYEIVDNDQGTLSIDFYSAIFKLFLGLDLFCLNIRGAGGGFLNIVLLYFGAALALANLVVSLIVATAAGISVATIVISVIFVLLSGPIVVILVKTAQRESSGDDELISTGLTGLAEPTVTPIAHVEKV